MSTLPDFSNGFFKTRADCPILKAEGELADKIINLTSTDLAKALDHSFGKDSNSWDLYPFYSLLVTSNCNKNLDVFDPIQVWRARYSPKYKSVNWMHNQGQIIGHILQTLTVDAELKPIKDDTKEEDLPYTLHVLTASCLFKVWEDPQKQAEINRIIADIEEGRLHVSMECLFKNFNFWMKNKSTGDQKILPRTSETAFLTKHLRQYHGTGEYQNYILGRLLEDITFSAQGIVTQPANPSSVISDNLNIFNQSNANFSKSVYINLEQLNGELNMADKKVEAKTDWDVNGKFEKETEEKEPLTDELHKVGDSKAYNLLLAKYNDLKGQLDKINAKIVAEKDKEVEEMKETCAKVKKTLDDVVDEKEKKAEKVKALEAELATAKTQNDAYKSTLDAYEEATRKASRTEAILKADATLTREKASEMVEKFKDLHDTTFAAMVETLKGYASRAPKTVTPEKILSKAKVEDMGTTNAPVEDTAKAFYTQVKDAFSKGAK
jgi:hypothetical protein